jgi:hypothetical protein
MMNKTIPGISVAVVRYHPEVKIKIPMELLGPATITVEAAKQLWSELKAAIEEFEPGGDNLDELREDLKKKYVHYYPEVERNHALLIGIDLAITAVQKGTTDINL